MKAIATEVNAVSVFQDFCKEEEYPNEGDIYGILNDIELIIHKCSGFGFNLENYFQPILP